MSEITQCPQCQRKLNVQEAQLGQTVQCPVCGAFFTAAVVGTQRAPSPPPMPEEREPPRRSDPPPRGRDNDDRRPRYRDDDDDDYDRGRRSPRRAYRDPYGSGRPHRGGAVLAVGLIGLFISCLFPLVGGIMGGVAVSMANNDLQEMSRGSMDASGRGLTQGGQVCGVIAIIINCLLLLFICSGGFRALSDM